MLANKADISLFLFLNLANQFFCYYMSGCCFSRYGILAFQFC